MATNRRKTSLSTRRILKGQVKSAIQHQALPDILQQARQIASESYGFDIAILKDARLLDAKKPENPATFLLSRGITARHLIRANLFPGFLYVRELKRIGYSAKYLKDKKYLSGQLKDDYNPRELLSAGFTVRELLIDCGFQPNYLRRVAGVTVEQLIDAGITNLRALQKSGGFANAEIRKGELYLLSKKKPK